MSTAASRPRSEGPRLFVLMGVAGCGKSSIGAALAPRLDGVYLDGDAYHAPESIAKMSRGEPLSDDDRWPWLKRFAEEMAARPGVVIGGCSALKRAYRDCIRAAAAEPVLFIHLAGSRELIGGRMTERKGHFMPPILLDSQFAALEPPGGDEPAITVDIAASPQAVAERICAALQPGPA